MSRPIANAACGDHPLTDHPVTVYGDGEELADTVSPFLADGAAHGEGLLVVATPEHWQLYRRRLRGRGVDADALRASGQLLYLDAQETLDRFSKGGEIDAAGFDAVIGAAYRETSRGRRRVRAFGEMVDILWRDDDLPNALHLEDLWNGFLQRSSLSLLCAYEMDLLANQEANEAFEQVCAHHSAILGQRSDMFDRSVQDALSDVLGAATFDNLRRLMMASLPANGSLGKGERMMFWIRRNLPQLFDQLVAQLRGTVDLQDAAPTLPRVRRTSGHRILFIEDDPDDVYLMQQAFQVTRSEVELVAVEDEAAAKRHLRESRDPPDLVLMDLNLPRTTGIEILHWLRSHPTYCGLPVFVHSAAADRRTVRQAYDFGADAYISKEDSVHMLDQLAHGIATFLALREGD